MEWLIICIIGVVLALLFASRAKTEGFEILGFGGKYAQNYIQCRDQCSNFPLNVPYKSNYNKVENMYPSATEATESKLGLVYLNQPYVDCANTCRISIKEALDDGREPENRGTPYGPYTIRELDITKNNLKFQKQSLIEHPNLDLLRKTEYVNQLMGPSMEYHTDQCSKECKLNKMYDAGYNIDRCNLKCNKSNEYREHFD